MNMGDVLPPCGGICTAVFLYLSSLRFLNHSIHFVIYCGSGKSDRMTYVKFGQNSIIIDNSENWEETEYAGNETGRLQ